MSSPPAKVQQKKNNTMSEIALTAGLYLKSMVPPVNKDNMYQKLKNDFTITNMLHKVNTTLVGKMKIMKLYLVYE
jgi:hypothetical protein